MAVRAPELRASGEWLTSGPLTLADLRGKFVLLDFWTFCCVNCLHVLDELRPLEEKYADVLVVVGVHSPKFAHEKAPEAVRAAIARYGVHHPVVNDPDLLLWRQYAVRAWPTLVLIDPLGYVVTQAAGEGQVSALDRTLERLVTEHEERGTLHRGGGPYVPPPEPETALRFPAKAIEHGGEVLVADAGHRAIAVMRDGAVVRGIEGVGDSNGLAVLPDGRLVVADTAHHRLQVVPGLVVDLGATVTGLQTVTGPVPAVVSPWDVAWWPAVERVVIAAAGVHLLLSWDPTTGDVGILAGTTVEGLRDGPALEAWLAQPSGLAVDGDRLWFVDAETSALRWLTADGQVHTAVGEGLFDFGHVDGPAATARFQHPLGVTLLPDGSLAVLDTYNGAVRRYDPATGTVSTLATGLAEPSGAVVVDGQLLVVESAAHVLTPVDLVESQVDSGAQHTERPPSDVGTGRVTLTVAFTPAPGRKLDERYGPSTHLTVSASPPDLLVGGAGESTELTRDLVLAAGEGVLHVTAQAASCDIDAEHPACYLARQDWGVPVRVVEGGPAELRLVLLGD